MRALPAISCLLCCSHYLSLRHGSSCWCPQQYYQSMSGSRLDSVAPAEQVQWSQGATQGGSSGAALIDADSRKVVGVLTGGTTTCSIFSGADYFGKLSVVSSSIIEDSQRSGSGSVCI